MSKQSSEIRILCAALREQGFVVEIMPNGHYRATAPSGRKAQFSGSPSDHRNTKNAITRLKRIGYVHTKK